MRISFGLLAIYLLIKAFLLAVAIGLGFLLRWIIPALDLGISILIGLLATGLTIHYITRISSMANDLATEDLDSDDLPPITIIAPPEVISPRRRRHKTT